MERRAGKLRLLSGQPFSLQKFVDVLQERMQHCPTTKHVMHMSSLFVCLFTTRKYLTTCFLPSNYFYYFFLFQFVLLASLSASFLSQYCQEVWIKSSACKSKTHEHVNNVSTHSNLSIISAQSFLFISTSNS